MVRQALSQKRSSQRDQGRDTKNDAGMEQYEAWQMDWETISSRKWEAG